MAERQVFAMSSTVQDYLSGPAFSPRQLTSNEFTRKDLYLTYSPRQQRVVCVEAVPRLAKWLSFEFDPTIVHCIERPRALELDATRKFEIDFWTRNSRHEEIFWVFIAQEETYVDLGGRHPKDKMRWDQAAAKAGLHLQFFVEDDLLAQRTHIANCFRMLSHVQASRRIPHRMVIKGRVTELFEAYPHLSFQQIDSGIKDYPAQEVRAVVCSLIHDGSLFVKPTDLVTERTQVYRSLPS